MSGPHADPIRIVRGSPTEAELGAIVAVLYALAARTPAERAVPPRRVSWTARHDSARPPTSWRTPGRPPDRV